jgi:hypothetical protein
MQNLGADFVIKAFNAGSTPAASSAGADELAPTSAIDASGTSESVMVSTSIGPVAYRPLSQFERINFVLKFDGIPSYPIVRRTCCSTLRRTSCPIIRTTSRSQFRSAPSSYL